MRARPSPPGSRPRRRFPGVVALVLAAVGLAAPLGARQEAPTGPPAGAETLRVAVVAAPPLVYQDGEAWTGVAVDLVAALAPRLGFTWEVVPMAGEGAAIAALESGEVALAAGVAPPPASAAVVLGYPYAVSGHGIAVLRPRRTGFRDLLRLFLSWELLKMILGLLGVVVVIGTCMWLIERRLEEHEQFGAPAHKGIAAGIWWAVVTMTAVGYGDTLPRTAGGRAAAMTWMFVSLVLVAAFTATVTSQLTLSGFELGIHRPEDLGRVPVGVVEGSPSAGLLRERRVAARSLPTLTAALGSLRAGDIEAVVHPRPELCHATYRGGDDDGAEVEILPLDLGRHDHVLLSVPGLADDPRWDGATREVLTDDAWQDVLFRHLGC